MKQSTDMYREENQAPIYGWQVYNALAAADWNLHFGGELRIDSSAIRVTRIREVSSNSTCICFLPLRVQMVQAVRARSNVLADMLCDNNSDKSSKTSPEERITAHADSIMKAMSWFWRCALQ